VGHALRIIPLLLAGSALFADTALAGDWMVRTTLSETLSANKDSGDEEEDSGILFGSNSSLGLDVTARSYIYDFALNGSLGYQTYFGNAADIPESRLNYIPRLRSSYARRSKNTTVSFSGAYSYTPGTDIDGLEIETVNRTADRQSVNVNTTVAHKINPRNDVTLSAKAARTDYFGGTGEEIPNSTVGASIAWNNRRTKRTDFSLTTGVDWFQYEDDIEREKLLTNVRLGVKTDLSSQLKVNGSVGARLLYSSENEELPATGRFSSTELGWLANLGFNYGLKDGAINGSANYGLSPNSDGELESSLGLRLGLQYKINDMSTFGLGTQLRFAESGGDLFASKRMSISPSYSHTLARDWQFSATYQFALTDDEDGTTVQNAAYLTLSRSYVLLP
jgi:hypothetical protein